MSRIESENEMSQKVLLCQRCWSFIIEDDEIVEMQIEKLKTSIDQTVQQIIALLENRDYSRALEIIDVFIKGQTALSIYIDPELSALKLQLKKIEEDLSHKEVEKAEMIRKIEEFNHAYHKALGEIIEAILKAKMRVTKNKKDISSEDETLEREYQEAKEEYEGFHRDYESIRCENRIELDEESTLELKKAYREAAKLCHPDMVSENKEKAEEIFKELNDAYEKNDLKKVKEILLRLKSGEAFGIFSDIINDKEVLRQKIEIIKERLEQLDNEIMVIKADEVYQLLIGIEERESYFNDLRIQLEEELERLEIEANL